MGRLIYSATASLDGYIEDPSGGFRWAAPDDEVHAHINDRHRGVGTFLFGRRMYETMLFWESPPDDLVPVARDWAEIWRGADKIVYSRQLEEPSSERTRIEHDFRPETLRALVAAANSDVAIGGAELAAAALAAGIVDELQVHVVPIVVGGGKSWLPAHVELGLELLETRPFESGFVFARYRVASTRNLRL
jgi:dihydrofolate reductase